MSKKPTVPTQILDGVNNQLQDTPKSLKQDISSLAYISSEQEELKSLVGISLLLGVINLILILSILLFK